MNVAHSAPTRAAARAPRAAFTPEWLGGFQDLPREHGFEALRVEGALPVDLAGTLYRNGPGRLGVAGERYRHWFDADGALTAVRFEGGRALGAAKLVRTAGLAREEKAGKRLFGGYDTPLARPLREILFRDAKNPANTSVLVWQKRLFALCEAGAPHEISTRDLATIGETDLGVVRGAFSAHPHYVPSRRTTYDFGVAHGKDTTFRAYALPDDGAPREIARFDVPGVRMNHDFAVTDRHLVFVIMPLQLSLWSMLVRRQGLVSGASWHPERGSEIVVVPIDDPSRIVRFQVDAFMAEHVVNAFEDGGEIAFDYTHYASPYALEGFARGLVRGEIEAPLASSIRRARVDPLRRTLRTEMILDRPVELPRVAPRVEASRHRFAYYAAQGDASRARPFDAVLKHDLQTGRVEAYAPGEHEYAGEAVFVPKEGGSAEDDGWLLTMVYDARAHCTRLDVLDARGVGDGPVAKCWFDHPIAFGFHGVWAPTST